MDDGMEHKTDRIDKNVPFLALDLLASVITARIDGAATLLGTLHALTVDHAGGRACLPLHQVTAQQV